MVVVLCSVLVAAVLCEVQYQHPEEWQLWKTEHEKSYGSQREELERHFVWLANREYINTHNANSDIFGFTLAMNHFGDMVSFFNVRVYAVKDSDCICCISSSLI